MFSSFSSSFRAGRRPLTIVNPVALTGGFVWLNADIGNATNFGSTVVDGDTVTSWKDVYSGSHDANKAGNAGVKPVWKSNIQNGLGVVRFDGVNDSLNINPVNAPSPGLQGISAFGLFAVARMSSTTGTRPLTSTDTAGFRILYNGTNWSCTAANGTGTSTITGDTTKFHLFSLLFDGTQTGNANRLKLRYDGTEQVLNFGVTTVGATTSATASYFYVGEDNASNFFAGDVAELILYSRFVSATEIASVEQYMKTHWSI